VSENLIATSFKEWITDYVEALQEGQYIYSKDFAVIINKDNL
jgi:hypothetical protein|tara:strand:- start:3005 stop:3130 length:126 start_codon:yes stop_codon:yes gene_type:complete